ncbi:MAG: HEAT repeat domain-containing protein [Methanomicrobiaceae archaeon]|nr:HEAT repeat domain-containing protein [Methanomicrobiaceae archaeon]
MAVFDFFKSPSKLTKKACPEEEAIGRILSGNAEARCEAARSCLAMDGAALARVCGLMAQKGEEERRRIARALTTCDPDRVPALLPVIADAPPETQEACAEAIGRMKISVLDALFPAMVHEDAAVRRGSVIALGGMIRRNADALSAVCQMLGDADRSVQTAAAEVLRRAEWEPTEGPEKASFYFLLEDWTRLARMKKRALPLLLGEVRSGDPGTRAAIIRTLADIRDAQALPVLIGLLEDAETAIRAAAIEALGAMGDGRAVPALEPLLQDPYPQVRMEAAWALDRLGWRPADPPQAAAYLVALEQWNRLAEMGAPAVQPLIGALRQDHSGVRAGAVEALRTMGAPGREALSRAARSGDPARAGAARDALRVIGEKNASEARRQPAQEDDAQFQKEYEEGMAARTLHAKEHPCDPRGRRTAISREENGRSRAPGPDPEGPELERLVAESGRKVRAGFREAGAASRASPAKARAHSGDERRGETVTADEIAASERAVREGLAAVRRGARADGQTDAPGPDDGDAGTTGPAPADDATLAEALRTAAAPHVGTGPGDGLATPDPLRDLLRALQHRDEEVRAAAIESLRMKGEEAVEYLLEALHDESHAVRQAAAEALGHIGTQKAAGPLISMLRDPYEDVRIAAAGALGALKNMLSIRFLAGLFEDGYCGVRIAAADALAAFGEPALSALTEALGSPSVVVRITAARALGTLGHAGGIPSLVEALADEVAEVRRGAAHALGEIGGPAIPPLAWIMQHGGVAEKLAALDALGAIFDDRATDAIMSALHDDDPDVREKAAKVLRRRELLHVWRSAWLARVATEEEPASVGTLHAEDEHAFADSGAKEIDTLITALKERKGTAQVAASMRLMMMGRPAVEGLIRALRNENRAVQMAAAELLGEMRDVAVDPLMGALQDADPFVRSVAARSLGKIGSDRSVEALIASLHRETTTRVRATVAEALGYIGHRRSIDPLVIALRDRDEEVQIAAASSLGYIGDRQAIEPLIQALNDVDYRVRRVALQALNDSSGLPQEHLVNALKYGEKEFKLGVAEALDQVGWKPGDRQEEACYLIAKGRWGELEYLGSAAVGPLLEVYADAASDLRFEAVRAIARIGGDEADRALARVLQDDNPVLRKLAERALGQRDGGS